MLWTTDEEIGSATSRAAIEACARESAAVLVLEPSLPGGAAKTSRKGCGDFELDRPRRVGARRPRPGEGRQRHSRAGAPDRRHRRAPGSGSRRHAERRPDLRRLAHERRRRHRARASIDVRVPTMADAAIGRAVAPRAASAAARDAARDPRRRRPSAARARTRASSASTSSPATWPRELGRTWRRAGPAAARTGILRPRSGVPTLDGLGPRGDGAHALHEHVELDDLAWRAAFLARAA